MKSIKILIFLLGITLSAQAQYETVKGTTKLNADFGKYKTFTWTQMASANDLIQSAIQQELSSRGYRQDVNGDLIVSYRILEKRISVKGYINDSPVVVAGEEIRQPADTTTFMLEPGTLMISMIDRKTSESVWDGFASGLSNSNAFTVPEKVNEIVRRIFEEFKHRATPLEN